MNVLHAIEHRAIEDSLTSTSQDGNTGGLRREFLGTLAGGPIDAPAYLATGGAESVHLGGEWSTIWITKREGS